MKFVSLEKELQDRCWECKHYHHGHVSNYDDPEYGGEDAKCMAKSKKGRSLSLVEVSENVAPWCPGLERK